MDISSQLHGSTVSSASDSASPCVSNRPFMSLLVHGGQPASPHRIDVPRSGWLQPTELEQARDVLLELRGLLTLAGVGVNGITEVVYSPINGGRCMVYFAQHRAVPGYGADGEAGDEAPFGWKSGPASRTDMSRNDLDEERASDYDRITPDADGAEFIGAYTDELAPLLDRVCSRASKTLRRRAVARFPAALLRAFFNDLEHGFPAAFAGALRALRCHVGMFAAKRHALLTAVSLETTPPATIRGSADPLDVESTLRVRATFAGDDFTYAMTMRAADGALVVV